ncbi:MAG: TIGR04290 family methyltransferase [Acidobacteria bacterium]|nr:TIGR04290 family methyltransferase [Acidobacteriota bacterium]
MIGERERMRQRVAELGPWFHNLHLPGGIQTAPDHPLGDFPSFKWRQVAAHLPQRIDGWRVLDIGCNAGYYSLELARRGARVVAIDHDPHYLEQAKWAASVFGLANAIDYRRQQVYELARGRERFDLVLFMGVFYHLRYPTLGLDIAARLAENWLVFQTLTMPGRKALEPPEDFPIDERQTLLQRGWPKMAFIERSMAGDPTNWWIANHAAVEALLRAAGLRVTARPGHEIYLCRRDPAACRTPWDEDEFLSATGQL